MGARLVNVMPGRYYDAPLNSRVRARRAEIDITQPVLAERARVSVETVRRIEQGVTKRPRDQELAGIAAALGMSVGALCAGTDDYVPAAETADLTPNDLRVVRAFRGNLRQIADYLIQMDARPEYDRNLIIAAVEWAYERIEAAERWEETRHLVADADLAARTPRPPEPDPAPERATNHAGS